MIKILTRLIHFVKTALTATPSDEKCGDHLGATKFCFQCKMNITERLGRSENRAVILRKFLLCSVKVDTLKVFAAALCAAKLFLFHCISCGTAWPPHFQFASYTYAVEPFQNLCILRCFQYCKHLRIHKSWNKVRFTLCNFLDNLGTRQSCILSTFSVCKCAFYGGTNLYRCIHIFQGI